jgi:hypothetical protein
MQANQELDIDFSLIIPTRERLDRLHGCLLSFFNKAHRKHANEAIIIVDHDDKSARDLSDFILKNELNARILTVWRSKMMIRDYNNYGGQCSQGRYIWMLNDDYEAVTPSWDLILKTKIEKFLEDKPDRIAYVSVNDSTHSKDNWNIMESHGCCCPIMTRETMEAMNSIMPWQIRSWGADIALFQIFKKTSKPRLVNAIEDVRVLHHCRHNNTATIDAISRRIESISTEKSALSSAEEQVYINAINQRLG